MEPLPSSEREQPARTALRVVAIGGGTGLSTLLKGLKKVRNCSWPASEYQQI